MKKIQVTLSVPDDLDTIDHLELYVNQLGQQFKRKAFSALVSQMINQANPNDSAASSCPFCKKKQTVSIGSRPRTLQTIFGDVDFHVARRKCQDCQQTWSLNLKQLENLQPAKGSNITAELRRIAILCGSSWPFRQAADVLKELTGVSLSFSPIRWLCSNEALTVATQANEKYKQVEWLARVETMEVLVEYLADEPNLTPKDTSSEQDKSAQRVYMGIDGTFSARREKPNSTGRNQPTVVLSLLEK